MLLSAADSSLLPSLFWRISVYANKKKKGIEKTQSVNMKKLQLTEEGRDP